MIRNRIGVEAVQDSLRFANEVNDHGLPIDKSLLPSVALAAVIKVVEQEKRAKKGQYDNRHSAQNPQTDLCHRFHPRRDTTTAIFAFLAQPSLT
jgi:hypothetical protein